MYFIFLNNNYHKTFNLKSSFYRIMNKKKYSKIDIIFINKFLHHYYILMKNFK